MLAWNSGVKKPPMAVKKNARAGFFLRSKLSWVFLRPTLYLAPRAGTSPRHFSTMINILPVSVFLCFPIYGRLSLSSCVLARCRSTLAIYRRIARVVLTPRQSRAIRLSLTFVCICATFVLTLFVYFLSTSRMRLRTLLLLRRASRPIPI